jgi:hypothetical protein
MPGEDPEWPWKTVANNKRAGLLVKEALESKNPLRLGIALHTLQDTYSHQGFSGWREDRNSCYVWYAPLSAIPNVGHAEMRTAPDVVSEVWTDPRGEKTKVKNSDRAMKAAARTFQVLAQWNGTTNAAASWRALKPSVRQAFTTSDYDKRKSKIMALGGDNKTRFSSVSRSLNGDKPAFAQAAFAHLLTAMSLVKNLPRH